MQDHSPRSPGGALDPTARKEVKIRIPAHVHVRLHSLKILTGREIGDVVTEALDKWFQEHEVKGVDYR